MFCVSLEVVLCSRNQPDSSKFPASLVEYMFWVFFTRYFDYSVFDHHALWRHLGHLVANVVNISILCNFIMHSVTGGGGLESR